MQSTRVERRRLQCSVELSSLLAFYPNHLVSEFPEPCSQPFLTGTPPRSLNRQEYENWAQSYHEAIFASLTAVPGILFVKEGPYLNLMARSGASVVSLGRRHNLAGARSQYPHLVFQGNVDEALLRSGTPELVAEATRACVLAGGGQHHIVNLNHGVDRLTATANFAAYIQAAKSVFPANSVSE